MSTSGAPPLEFVYRFQFADGETREFQVRIDPQTLAGIDRAPEPWPAWTKLEFQRCPNCPLDPARSPHCPPAVAIKDVVETFAKRVSYEDVDVSVTTKAREYRARTSLQKGLSALLGLLMPSAGCPILDKLRPMIVTHLPFMTAEETTFRMLSLYLVARHFADLPQGSPDRTLDGLVEYFSDIAEVNRAFSDRLRAAYDGDANVNALVVLSVLSSIAGMAIEGDALDRLRDLFRTHWR